MRISDWSSDVCSSDLKVEIAKRYLVKRQLDASGLKPEQATITEDAIHAIIRDYTREAGVRNLERQNGAVFGNAAVRVAEGEVERPEERRDGTECVRTCRSRWSP